MNIQKVIGAYGFTDEEKEYLMSPPADSVQKQTQSRVFSEFVLGKRIEQVADKMISSNKILADATGKYAGRMVWLTVALVFVGAVQAIATLASSLPYIRYFLSAGI